MAHFPALPQVDANKLLQDLKNTRSPIPVVRPLLNSIQEESFAYFKHNLDAVTLVKHRAKLIDIILACLWQHLGLKNDGLALIAVGGYGRGELHPYSDIDLLILCKGERSISSAADSLQSFIALLWDLKLDIGHSVRTLSECESIAESDLTIITNMMESRPICGNLVLHGQLLELIKPSNLWPVHDFFNAKWEEIRNRQRKYNDSEYNLEPNVKNSPGALRDIQTVNWVTMRHFEQGSLESLAKKGFLTQSELERLLRSLHFLWQVRFALHMLTGRSEDRLLFNLQRQVSGLLGFKDTPQELGVEQFMRHFYRNQLTTMELCDLLLLHFNEDIIKLDSHPVIEELNKHFRLNNGYLQVIDPDLFKKEPHWLLQVFLLMAQTPHAKGIHFKTIRALRTNRHLINESFRTTPRHNAIFIELLHNGTRVVRELRRMMRYGVLGRYIPEFGNIIGMMEHDLFHIYTVDEHSFRMLHFLRHLRFGKIRELFPLASELALTYQDQKEILYLTALLHDTGKSQAGSHTENSEDIARKFCQQHQVSTHNGEMIAWLCKNHLLMSSAAQQLELNNPEEVYFFAQQVKSQLRLDLLYLVSVSDIYSTNPKHWTSWRAEQINHLYKSTSEALARGLENPASAKERVSEIRTAALQLLQRQGMEIDLAESILGQPGHDYFLREGAENIAWHTMAIHQHKDSNLPLVAIRPTSTREHEGATQIFIFLKDQEYIFAAATATLDQLNVNIQDARIMTSDSGNAIDTFIVLDENNQPIENEERLQHIQQSLIEALTTPADFTTLIQRRTPRALKQFNVTTKVNLSNDPLKKCTVLEVIAADRPGLLARMGAIFAEYGVQLRAAKILTEGEQVQDIFHILNRQGEPFSDPIFLEELKEAIIQGLAEQVAVQSAV